MNVVPLYFICTKCKQIECCRPKNEVESNYNIGTQPLLRHGCMKINTSTSNTQRIEKFYSTTNIKVDSSDIDAVKNRMSQFVAADIRPINAVEGFGFQEVCKIFFELGRKYGNQDSNGICGKLIPSRNTVD